MVKAPFSKFAMALIVTGMALGAASAQRFYRDDPLPRDPDNLPVPKPDSREVSQIADFLENTFLRRPEGPVPASENVNTLGEVPDSTWFTNRIGVRGMTPAELARGSNLGEGPNLTEPITIIRAKTQGVTPGFTVRDGRGDVYFIKFDPLPFPQLATSTEVIATKFFHAIGYHVPENHLIRVRPEMLRLADTARFTDESGNRRQMTEQDVAEILERVPRLADGSRQAVASLALPGDPLGPFNYHGTRGDDANDIFPHENRRELRGLRIFAAWLNHDDARSINSLDTYLGEPGGGHVRHHLIDFGSCFGSGSVKRQTQRAGHEYILEWKPILASAFSLGWIDREWRKIPYPEHPGIGRFESAHFQPQLWKPEYPNPAFERMLLEDAFWAVRIVGKFSDEAIAAIVATGGLNDPRSEHYLVQTLVERRDKILRHYLSLLNPLSDFAVRGRRLVFENLGQEAGLAESARYRHRWSVFNNATGESRALTDPAVADSPSLPIPESQAAFLQVEIETLAPGLEAWSQPVRVFLRNGAAPEPVGVQRSASDSAVRQP